MSKPTRKPTPLATSRHARIRAAQRAVGHDLLSFVVDWGAPIRQAGGRTAWHFGHREARDARRAQIHIPERALNLCVVLAPDETVVTVIRSADRHRIKLSNIHRYVGS